MMFLILASVILAAVNGQAANSDPTKACLPDVLQVTSASLLRDVKSTVVFNFPENKVATRMNNGLRSVINLADNTIATLNETSGACGITPLPSGLKAIASQCLPASATRLTPGHTFLGLSPNSVEIEGWEYTVANFGTVRVAVTNSSPGVLVLGQIDSPIAGLSDVQIFVNPKTTIDDATVFAVPDDCPRAVARK